jgi:hypothetical protein
MSERPTPATRPGYGRRLNRTQQRRLRERHRQGRTGSPCGVHNIGATLTGPILHVSVVYRGWKYGRPRAFPQPR